MGDDDNDCQQDEDDREKNSNSPLHHHQLRRLGDELVQEEGLESSGSKRLLLSWSTGVLLALASLLF